MKTLNLFISAILFCTFLSVTEAQWVQVSSGMGNIAVASLANKRIYF